MKLLFFESALKIMTVTIQAKHWNLDRNIIQKCSFHSISYLNLISLKIKSRSFWRNCNTGWFSSNKLSFLKLFPPSLSSLTTSQPYLSFAKLLLEDKVLTINFDSSSKQIKRLFSSSAWTSFSKLKKLENWIQ